MSDHYYSSKPSSVTDYRKITTSLRGQTLTFLTDAGVFSKKGIDFGSRLLIESVDLSLTDRVLDLGCGYGPIGISLAKAHPKLIVTMVDINERAVELARKNAQKNGVQNQVEIYQSDGFSRVDGMFHHVITNPPIRIGKQKIYQFFEDAKSFLYPGGKLWIVIRKQQGAASAKVKLEELYEEVEVFAKEKGYWIVVAKCH